jgi:hypothetical protein
MGLRVAIVCLGPEDRMVPGRFLPVPYQSRERTWRLIQLNSFGRRMIVCWAARSQPDASQDQASAHNYWPALVREWA